MAAGSDSTRQLRGGKSVIDGTSIGARSRAVQRIDGCAHGVHGRRFMSRVTCEDERGGVRYSPSTQSVCGKITMDHLAQGLYLEPIKPPRRAVSSRRPTPFRISRLAMEPCRGPLRDDAASWITILVVMLAVPRKRYVSGLEAKPIARCVRHKSRSLPQAGPWFQVAGQPGKSPCSHV